MTFLIAKSRLSLRWFFCAALVCGVFFTRPVLGQGWDKQAPGKPDAIAPSVLVEPGAPHAWTMEQAHYLLERNRAHDLGLSEADPGTLDPNDIVGLRVQSVRSLFSASVQFDPTAGVKNSLAQQQYDSSMALRTKLLAQQQQLIGQQTDLAFQLANANAQLAVLKAATTPDQTAIAVKTAQVNDLSAKSTALSTQMTALQSLTPSMPSLPALTAVTPNDAAGSNTVLGTDADFTKALGTFNPGTGASRLSATDKLNNYVDFQYEMVARLLTLLRDEAGPDNRVLFLELPHSIYVTSKFHPYPYLGGLWGDHLVQAWWKVDSTLSATELNKDALRGGVHRAPTVRELQQLSLQVDTSAGNCTADKLRAAEQPAYLAALGTDAPHVCDALQGLSEFYPAGSQTKNAPKAKIFGDIAKAQADKMFSDADLNKTSLKLSDRNSYANWAQNWYFSSVLHQDGQPGSTTAPVYTLDLIPRQDSLNVNDADMSLHQGAFTGLFSWLTGIGARARYERQTQQYNQFTQNEQYASAFGKGDYTFGWTFSPKPGTKKVDSGLRTTYVILVVPRDTRVVRMRAMGCGYRRRNVPRNPFLDEVEDGTNEQALSQQHKLGIATDCGALSTYDVEVPDSDDNFWINSAVYDPVPAGQRSTLTLTGRFGDQVGVLINGTPLQKVPSLAQPQLTPAGFSVPASAGDSGISGVFELVHNRSSNEDTSSDIVASFVMPSTYVGTPRVTLISAAKQRELSLDETFGAGAQSARDPEVSDLLKPRLKADQTKKLPMFYGQAAIKRIDLTYLDATHVQVNVVGSGFDDASTLVIGPTTYGPHKAVAGPVPPVPVPAPVPVPVPAPAPAPAAIVVSDKYEIMASGGLLQVVVDRDKVFPHAQVDYFTPDRQQPGQMIDASSSFDDSGPQLLDTKIPCTAKADAAVDGKRNVSFKIVGKYFLASVAPKLSAGDSPTSTFTSATEWDMTASVADGTKSVTVTITPANKSLGSISANCPITPAPALKAAPAPAAAAK